jgi:hypothetical protein
MKPTQTRDSASTLMTGLASMGGDGSMASPDRATASTSSEKWVSVAWSALRRRALLRHQVGPRWTPDNARRPGHDDDGRLACDAVDLGDAMLPDPIDGSRNSTCSDGTGQLAQPHGGVRGDLGPVLGGTLRSNEAESRRHCVQPIAAAPRRDSSRSRVPTSALRGTSPRPRLKSEEKKTRKRRPEGRRGRA